MNLNNITMCPVCNDSLVPYNEDPSILMCPENSAEQHQFKANHFLDNNKTVFSITLDLERFHILWFPRRTAKFKIMEPHLVIAKMDSSKDERLFEGIPDFDWNQIVTNLPAVRKKLKLWRTFE